MAFSMSGGQYSYNRFTEYERLIEEKVKQADKYGEKKMEKGLDKGSKPDYIDIDGDGNKEESMKKAAKEAKNEHMNYYADVLSRLALNLTTTLMTMLHSNPREQYSEIVGDFCDCAYRRARISAGSFLFNGYGG